MTPPYMIYYINNIYGGQENVKRNERLKFYFLHENNDAPIGKKTAVNINESLAVIHYFVCCTEQMA